MPTATLVGSETPRLWTKPARELTPETSLGFRCIAFAEDVLGMRLDPWQRWFLIHALELNVDGSFRFRTILLLVARQNGKTEVVKALVLWLMFTGRARLVVGSAQNLQIARVAWESSCALARNAPAGLEVAVAKVRQDNNDPHLLLTNAAKYVIAASTEDAARGIPGVDCLILDELRTHRDSRAWGALTKTTMARPNALTVGLSNAGSDDSVVLNSLREAALDGRDDTVALFEWSAPDGCALDDPEAIAQANPSLGHGRTTMGAIRSAMATDPPAVFRTEVLCQRVETLDGAIDLPAWRASVDPVDLKTIEGRRAVCLDVAPDGEHVALVVAVACADGRIRVEPAKAWRDTTTARKDLAEFLDRIDAEVEAWFPSGPAAVFAPVMARRKKARELKGADVVKACMGFADLVRAGRILHSGDHLLDAQVGSAARYHQGDGWRFVRRGVGHVDAAYAAAGAALVVQELPKPRESWEGVVL